MEMDPIKSEYDHYEKLDSELEPGPRKKRIKNRIWIQPNKIHPIVFSLKLQRDFWIWMFRPWGKHRILYPDPYVALPSTLKGLSHRERQNPAEKECYFSFIDYDQLS